MSNLIVYSGSLEATPAAPLDSADIVELALVADRRVEVPFDAKTAMTGRVRFADLKRETQGFVNAE